MLPDYERKVLRILYNYINQRLRMPTMKELEIKTGQDSMKLTPRVFLKLVSITLINFLSIVKTTRNTFMRQARANCHRGEDVLTAQDRSHILRLACIH